MKRLIAINERYLLLAVQILTGLLFLVPLVTMSDFYFPFVVPRNVLFRTLVELLLVVYLLLISQNRNFLPRKHPLWIILLLFAGGMTVSSFVAGEFGFSFWSTYERMEGLVTMYHLLIFFFVLYATHKDRLQWERLLQMSIFVAIAVSFVGLSQYLGVNLLLESSGGERISSTLGNATYLSAYLLTHLFIALYFLFKPKEQTDLWFYKYGFVGLDVVLLVLQFMYGGGARNEFPGILGQVFSSHMLWIPFIALQILAFAAFRFLRVGVSQLRSVSITFYVLAGALFLFLTVSTQTRGAIVGLALSLLFACVLITVRRGEKPAIRLAAVAIIVISVVGAWLVFANAESTFVRSQPLLQKVATISLTDNTTQSRLATWRASYEAFLERPIFGWGVENFHVAFNKYFPTVIYHDEGNPLWFDRPHNLLLQYLVEGGVLAFGLYLTFIILLIIYIIRRQPQRRIGILFSAFIVAYIGQNLFVFDSINSYIPLYLVLGFMTFLVTRNGEHPVTPILGGLRSRMLQIILTLAAIVFVGWNFVYDAWAVQTNRAFVIAYRLQREAPGGYNPTITDQVFEVIDGSPDLGKAELLGVYSENAVDLLQDTSVPKESIRPLVEGVIGRFERLISENDNDARLHLFLMNLYLNADGLNADYLDKLLVLSERALVLSPTRPQIYYLRGRAMMKQGKFEEGLAEFKKGVELAPDVFDAHWNLFAAYATVGETADAENEITILKGLRTFDADRYLRTATIYASTQHLSQAETALLEGIGTFPDDIELLVALAQVYAREGRNEEARELIKRVTEKNPSLAEQAEEFYRRLDAGEYLPSADER